MSKHCQYSWSANEPNSHIIPSSQCLADWRLAAYLCSRYISSKDCFPVGFPLDGKPPRTLGCTPEHLRILFQPFFKGLDPGEVNGRMLVPDHYQHITSIYDISVKTRALRNMLRTAAREA